MNSDKMKDLAQRLRARLEEEQRDEDEDEPEPVFELKPTGEPPTLDELLPLAMRATVASLPRRKEKKES